MKILHSLATLLFVLILLIQLDLNPIVEATDGSSKSVSKATKGLQKVKCKEKVDEALRQYFKDEDDDDNDDNDDVDDDDADDGNESDEDALENDRTDNQDYGDDDNDEDNDDDDDDDQSGEKASDNDSNDDDDDDDSKESAHENEDDDDEEKNQVKKSVQSVEKNSAHDDEDDDDDDNDDDEPTPIPAKKKKESGKKNKNNPSNKKASVNKKSSQNDHDDDEDDDENSDQPRRSRAHIDDILKVYEIGSQDDNAEQNLIQSIFRDVKRVYESTVKPLETIYKYRQITTRLITDSEIFSKPMILFLGGKSTGKSSLVNYLLGIDGTSWQIPTGAASQTKFSILTYGDNYTHLSPIELAADFTFSSLQRFGEQFIADYIDARRLPINILQKMVIVDSPGLIDMVPTAMAKQTIDNDVYQWFIDRSDVIYIVIDVSQLHLSTSLRALLDQLKGREVRFIIAKADMASHSQIISMFGQLLWVLSPIMSHERPPMVYALSTLPQDNFDEFVDSQETSWLKDLSQQLSGISRIESHIAEVRRHAVRVRNHAKLIDCYLSTFYKNKGLFTFGSSSRQLAADIAENPHQYRIYSGAFMGQLQNVSRYDLPDPGVYREFFRSNPLIDFKPLTSTCSYFRGCPIDRLDVAIAYDLPELVGKYKKLTKTKFEQN
ncbi:sarcalumenin isoform X1 [Dermatophagoides farinae]|uniref:sarcalumenin isoform X1 n=1 Tax=Dermatophagoides farinae TaxID=6954 RepID=UPI003F61378F